MALGGKISAIPAQIDGHQIADDGAAVTRASSGWQN
jgi:hypothetical protein